MNSPTSLEDRLVPTRDISHDNKIPEDLDLEQEIEVIRSGIETHRFRARNVTYQWVGALFDLFIGITKSSKLRENLEATYDKMFRPHPRATTAWRLLKLCTRETDTPPQTAHRWSQTLEIAGREKWSADAFREKLEADGIEGVLRLARSTRPQRQTTGNLVTDEPLMRIRTDPLQQLAVHLVDEEQLYVLIAVRKGEDVEITKVLELTPALLKAIERAQSTRMTPKSSIAADHEVV